VLDLLIWTCAQTDVETLFPVISKVRRILALSMRRVNPYPSWPKQINVSFQPRTDRTAGSELFVFRDRA